MKEFVIVTDTTTDLPREYVEKHHLYMMSLPYTLEGTSYTWENPMPVKEFYDKMRAGSLPTTSQANPEEAAALYESILKENDVDILHIAFSSGLSGSFNSCRIAAADVCEKYPDRRIVVVDSLAATLGQGLLVYKAVQLKEAGKLDKLDEVMQEVPRVRADAGYPPLVTPSSQIVGTQAVFNVITGERYKMCTNEFKGLVRGQYGQTPIKIDPEFRKKIIGDEEPIECRPADLLEPELEKLRGEISEFIEQDEDVLSYAQFPQVSKKFFEERRNKKYGIDGEHLDMKEKVHPV